MSNNPYEIDVSKLKISREITNPNELLKLQLGVAFASAVSNMETTEILEKTGLDKADLSRLRSMSGGLRFSIERLLSLLQKVGYTAKISLEPIKKKAV